MGQRLGNGIAQFLSDVLDVLAVGCLCLGFCLRAGGWTVSNNIERIRR